MHPSARKPRLILVEDDPSQQELLRRYLEQQGMEVLVASGDDTFQRLHARGRTDLILLDLSLGTADGLDICRRLRAAGDDTPLIITSGKTAEVDRVLGLEMGADDYVGKPIPLRELLARIHALLRRRPLPEPPGAPAQSAELIRFGPYDFDLQRRQLRRDGETLPLTTGEFAMLKALARHPRQPLSREQLAQLARGRTFGPYDRSLDVQISRLRRLVETDPAHPQYIQTVWGVGYVFVPDDSAAH